VFFLSNNFTDYHLLQRVEASLSPNIEIASHTLSHTTGTLTNLNLWGKEMNDGREFASKLLLKNKTDVSDTFEKICFQKTNRLLDFAIRSWHIIQKAFKPFSILLFTNHLWLTVGNLRPSPINFFRIP
jgi:hypothetical protein